MKALDSRKQLLIAESELNRAHLLHEWQTIAGGAHALASQAKTVGSVAAVVALLVAGLSSLRQKKSTPAAEKPSWWQTIGKAGGMVAALWSAFRTRSKT